MSQQFNQTSQASFVFINSSDPKIPSQVINDVPFIKLPFPPTINPRNLISFPKGSSTPSRAPNAFIIYRKLFIQTAKDNGYTLPMTVISTMASKSWEREPEFVKSEYKRIAKDAFNYRSEIHPKQKQERGGKRKQWNIVSFDCSDKQKSHESTDKSQQALRTPPPEFFSESPILDLDELDLFADWANFIYPSPDLNTTSQYNSPDLNNTSQYNSPDLNTISQYNSPDLNTVSQYNSPDLNIVSQFNSPDLSITCQFGSPDLKFEFINSLLQTVDNNSLTPIQPEEFSNYPKINNDITENDLFNDYVIPESTENQYNNEIFNTTSDSSESQFTFSSFDLLNTELFPEELNTVTFDDNSYYF
ncbi:2514_t:CDS:2 [Diversispora eburnea]|uniref:2514_t:CDS:1 n=1 Tax=Diversispora eburnea TaxID=1213867 RepID=A0A9N8VR27_9GLOM|nr:2514_t:CDS:2 [Diversispora eburnea]